jgi:hypothetical protein
MHSRSHGSWQNIAFVRKNSRKVGEYVKGKIMGEVRDIFWDNK